MTSTEQIRERELVEAQEHRTVHEGLRRRAEAERDELIRLVQAEHRAKAAIGGPCVCKWCKRKP